MFAIFLEHARKIRHVLDAWCVLFLCPIIGLLPWLGLPLGELFGILGIGTAVQLVRDQKIIKGLLFLLFFSVWLVAFPILRLNKDQLLADKPQAIRHQQSFPRITPPPPSFPQPTKAALHENRQTQPQPVTDLSPAISKTLPALPAISSIKPPEDSPIAVPARNIPEEPESVIRDWWQARSRGNVENAVALHTAPTTMEGRSFSSDELRAHLASDWQRNAAVSESSVGMPVVSQNAGQWKVECLMRFAVPVPGKNYPRMGQCLHTFLLSDDGRALRISEHRETVLPVLPPGPSAVSGMKVTSLLSLMSTCLEADLVGDLDASMSLYAPSVVYFGKSQSRDQIRADKQSYFERWPSRIECFQGDFAVAELPGKKASARFQGQFRTMNRERGEWFAGIVEHRFIFALSGGQPVIVEQSGTILQSRKGTY